MMVLQSSLLKISAFFWDLLERFIVRRNIMLQCRAAPRAATATERRLVNVCYLSSFGRCSRTRCGSTRHHIVTARFYIVNRKNAGWKWDRKYYKLNTLEPSLFPLTLQSYNFFVNSPNILAYNWAITPFFFELSPKFNHFIPSGMRHGNQPYGKTHRTPFSGVRCAVCFALPNRYPSHNHYNKDTSLWWVRYEFDRCLRFPYL